MPHDPSANALDLLEPRALLAFTFADPIVPSAPQVSPEVGIFADRAVSADFDGDNVPDLAVSEGNRIGFLKGNADGTFQDPVFKTVGSRVGRLALAQDADGTNVLLSIGGVGPFASADNDAALFRSAIVRRFVFDGDFNRFEKTGQVQLLRPAILGNAVGPIVAGDATGDGRADAIVDFGSLLLIRSRPNGELTLTRFLDTPPGAFATTVSLADITGDDKPDVIIQARMPFGTAPVRPIVYTSSATGLSRTALSINLDGRFTWQFIDINNDNAVDAVTLVRTTSEPTSALIPGQANFAVRVRLALPRPVTPASGNFFQAPANAGIISTTHPELTASNPSAESVSESVSFTLVPNLAGSSTPGVGILLQRSTSYNSRSGDDSTLTTVHALPLLSTSAPGVSSLAYTDTYNQTVLTPSTGGPRIRLPITDYTSDAIPDALRIDLTGRILTFAGLLIP